ncbi:Outer membrane porin protein (plasmid) [Caballeronia sp. SBC1]|uniref:porin n=1 Tax=unclassified Caballeronia TaxID=2646786 RepID=UPI0013E1AE21|nr:MULTISPECIES: porin [unclassified Caballeronia]QIE27065.1 Outer membrane porin protein [Caballeronia sp. SBC2]QIN63619.1 Outer membrane porin protein [Caballeronia sp. SBC1]
MKKTLLAAAIPALFLSTVAHAQSSVTLYGLIDEGFDFTSNGQGHRGYEMVSGDTVGSRWGVKGSEDLGNGLKGIFLLENGFNTNNGQLGQGGLEFGRQAYVGLSSAQYGTFTMGRQYDPTIDMWSGFTAAGNTIGDLAAHPFDNDNSDWDYRIQNSVKYVSPTYSGFTGEAMYGFSNQAGGFATNRMYSAAGTYKMGGFAAALAYMKTNSGGASTSGAVSSDTTVFTADSQQNIDAGVSYTFSNKALLSFAYSHVDVYNPTGNAYFTDQPVAGTQNSWKFDNFEVNGQYFFKPDFWMAAAYTYTFAHISATTGRSMPKYNQFSLMLDYDLSKSTSVYIQGAYQHVNGNTGTQFDNADIPGSSGISSTGNQMMARLAMTHRF